MVLQNNHGAEHGWHSGRKLNRQSTIPWVPGQAEIAIWSHAEPLPDPWCGQMWRSRHRRLPDSRLAAQSWPRASPQRGARAPHSTATLTQGCSTCQGTPLRIMDCFPGCLHWQGSSSSMSRAFAIMRPRFWTVLFRSVKGAEHESDSLLRARGFGSAAP
jgi:hypothetical protein